MVFYFLKPEHFTSQAIKNYLENYGNQMLWWYIVLSIFRGIVLIPSTPFVLAGAILFSHQLTLVFIISMIGIIVSATFIYYISNYLELDFFLDKVKSKRVENIRNKINKYGFWVVLGWSFFPLVPTDLICYVAGTIQMNFKKFIIALTIGEAILVSIYVFAGKEISEWWLS